MTCRIAVIRASSDQPVAHLGRDAQQRGAQQYSADGVGEVVVGDGLAEHPQHRPPGGGDARVVLIHHPPLTTEKHFKRLTDAAEFQAMIRRVGCEVVLHGHNHRSEIARIACPRGSVPVIGVTSASAAADSRYGRARYHMIGIERQPAGWRLAVQIRALKADGTGCEPDGCIVFESGEPLAKAA